MLQWQPYCLILFIGAAICTTVGLSAWRRRHAVPAARALVLAMAGLTEWATVEMIGSALHSLTWQTAMHLALFPGVAADVAGFLWLARLMVDQDARLPIWARALLFVEPVAITLTAATDPWHHLVTAHATLVGDPSLLSVTNGPAFWVHAGYSYAVLCGATVLVTRQWRTASSLFRRQVTPLLVGTAIPTVGNLVTILNLTGGVDVTVIGFIALGLCCWWSVFRRGLLQTAPVARGVVFDHATDVLVVVDRAGRVIDLNPAAERLLRQLREDQPDVFVGEMFERVLPPPPDGRPFEVGEYTIELRGREVILDVRSSDLTDRRGAPLGRVVVARDITELTTKKRQLAEANTQLQAQLEAIEALRRTLAEQAVRDELTGLYNRRQLMAELAEQTRADRPFSVVLLDIDHFKRINDTYGHPVGDELLRATAHLVRDCVGQSGTVARYGGEEFVVLLPGTRLESALRRADDWRHAGAEVGVPAGGGRSATTTFSAGVAGYPECGTTVEELLAAADEALYRAKRAGRDRVLPAHRLATAAAGPNAA